MGLPRDVFYEIVRVFRGSLPLPEVAGVDRGRRDRAAIAGAAAFRPVDASEAGLAAQIVLSEAWAAECLRLSGERGRDFSGAMRCRAQALGLMRDAKGARRLLAKTQAGRMAMERDEAAAGRAEMAEHVAAGMMGEALEALSARESEAGAVVDTAVVDGSVRHASAMEHAPEIGLGAFSEIYSRGTIDETRLRAREPEIASEDETGQGGDFLLNGVKGTTVPLRGEVGGAPSGVWGKAR